MWPWGWIAAWFIRKHIAREIRPYCEANKVTREDAISASHSKMRKHFDAAWPLST